VSLQDGSGLIGVNITNGVKRFISRDENGNAGGEVERLSLVGGQVTLAKAGEERAKGGEEGGGFKRVGERRIRLVKRLKVV